MTSRRCAWLSQLLWFLVSPVVATTHAASLPAGFSEALVAQGLSAPTAMASRRTAGCSSQQGGQLRVIKDGVLLSTPFLTLTVNSAGERGLLGVAFDPNFAVNRFVYVYYTATTPAVHNRISRFRANGDVVDTSEGDPLDFDNLSSATNHNGGALHSAPTASSTPQSATTRRSNAQRMNNLLGKISA